MEYQSWIYKPQAAVEFGTVEVSYYDYLGSTPLVRKPWFIIPWLTLML